MISSEPIAADDLYRPVPETIEKLTGRRPSPASCWRMINKGGRGGKLAAQFILGRWCCKTSDFLDYARRQSAATLEARSAMTPESRATAANETDLRAASLL